MSPAVSETSLINALFFSWRSGWTVSEADRSSLSEPDATEEEETENELYQAANRGAGKTLSQTEIPGLRRASGIGEVAKNDGRAGEDLVPKQADEMEVSSRDIFVDGS